MSRWSDITPLLYTLSVTALSLQPTQHAPRLEPDSHDDQLHPNHRHQPAQTHVGHIASDSYWSKFWASLLINAESPVVSRLDSSIHTTIGSTIRDFSAHASTPSSSSPSSSLPSSIDSSDPASTETEARGELLRKTWAVIGITLCIVLFIYLTIVARRAVDDTTLMSGGSSAGSSRAASPRYRIIPLADLDESEQRHGWSRDDDSSGGGGAGQEGAEEMSELDKSMERGRFLSREMRLDRSTYVASSGEGESSGGVGGSGGPRMSISGIEDFVGLGGDGKASSGAFGRMLEKSS